jgi:hypothetical protein
MFRGRDDLPIALAARRMSAALAVFPPAESGAVFGDVFLERGIAILRVVELWNSPIPIPAGAMSERSSLPVVTPFENRQGRNGYGGRRCDSKKFTTIPMTTPTSPAMTPNAIVHLLIGAADCIPTMNPNNARATTL